MRPVLDEVQAFKAAMRTGVPEARGRPPKPEMHGAPGGERGGRGENTTSLTGKYLDLANQLDEAEKLEKIASRSITAHTPSLGQMAGVVDTPSPVDYTYGMTMEEAKAALDKARKFKADVESEIARLKKVGGTQLEKRMLEELDRQEDQRRREKSREERKQATRPNYDQWKAGNDALGSSRTSRDRANDVEAGVRSERGKADPEGLRIAQDLSKEAKEVGKLAKKQAKKAKDAAKYGTKKEAEAAAAYAQELAQMADSIAGGAEKALEDARKKKDATVPVAPNGANATGDPGSTPVAHEGDRHDCSAKAEDVCQSITLPCLSGQTVECVLVPIEEGKIGPGEAKGSKGKGYSEEPGDTKGSTEDSTTTSAPQPLPPPPAGEVGEPPAPKPADGQGGDEVTEGESVVSDGVSGATEKRLKEEARETIEELFRHLVKIEDRIRLLRSAILAPLRMQAAGKTLAAGQRRAFQRGLAEIAVYSLAREAIEDGIAGTLAALGDGLRSRGKARDDAFFEVRIAETELPKAVREFLSTSLKSIRDGDGPLPDPDEALRAMRQDVEREVDARLSEAARGDPARRAKERDLVLAERERGDAPGNWTIALRAFSEAAAATPGTALTIIDNATGRPIRAGVLAARDFFHGSEGTEGSVWQRAAMGEFSKEIVHLYTAGLDPDDTSGGGAGLVRGIAVAAEFGSGVVGGSTLARVLHIAKGPLGGRVLTAARIEGAEGAAAGGRRLARTLADSAGGGRWSRSSLKWRYAETADDMKALGKADARTSWTGEIVVKPGTIGRDLVDLLKHERRHQILSPTSRLFQGKRAWLKKKAYWRSDLLRWGEEALAEGRAAYPFENPELYSELGTGRELSKVRIALEAIGYAGFVGGSYYATRKATEEIIAQPGQ